MMRRLQSEGRTIIDVTHFLDAVFAVCDRVSVMRDGRLIGTWDPSETTKDRLVDAMIGKPLEVTFPLPPPAPKPTQTPALELRDVRSGQTVRNVSLVVRPGE